MNGSPAEENVDAECLDADLELALAFDRVRKGFSVLPKLLRVRPNPLPPADDVCRGAMPGRANAGADCAGAGVLVVGENSFRSSFSSGGVRNGSSGGCCTIIGAELFVVVERIEGAYALGARNSLESAGSTLLAGTCRLR